MSTNDPSRIPWGATGVPLQPLQPANYIDISTSIMPQGSNISVNNTSSIIDKNVIRGSAIYVEHKEPAHITVLTNYHDVIKQTLMTKMLEFMLKNNYIEFTSQEDMASGEIIYRARAYLVPDDQVRTLRTTGYIE